MFGVLFLKRKFRVMLFSGRWVKLTFDQSQRLITSDDKHMQLSWELYDLELQWIVNYNCMVTKLNVGPTWKFRQTSHAKNWNFDFFFYLYHSTDITSKNYVARLRGIEKRCQAVVCYVALTTLNPVTRS